MDNNQHHPAFRQTAVGCSFFLSVFSQSLSNYNQIKIKKLCQKLKTSQ